MNAVDRIVEKLQKYPAIRHEHTQNNITVLPSSEDGFTVSLDERESGCTVHFHGWHETFNSIDEAINCFAFGLSEACRLVVFRRGSVDYRWQLQHFVEAGWRKESEVGLLFFPFWRRRTERILQNHLLPISKKS
jgi:hypothetical protein